MIRFEISNLNVKNFIVKKFKKRPSISFRLGDFFLLNEIKKRVKKSAHLSAAPLEN